MKGDELKALKEALKSRGWKQDLIAAEVGRSQAHVCYVLSGARQSRSLLAKLKQLSRRNAPKSEGVA